VAQSVDGRTALPSTPVRPASRWQLTHHPTPVVSYDLGRKGSEIVYEAAPAPIRFVDSEEVRRNGLVISTQDLEDLLPPQEDERDEPRTDRQLFIQSEGARAHRIPSPDYLTEYLPLSLSPNGRYAVLAVYLGDVPKSWAAYQEPVLRRYIVDQRKAGTLSNIQQYMLLDVRAGKLTPLVDAPKAWLDEGVRWSADSRSVVVSGVYLPPTGEIYGFPSAPKGQERLQHPFVVEVNLADRAIHVVAGANWRVYRWDTTRNRITLLPGYRAPQSRTTLFKKRGADWVPTAPAESEADVESSISVTLEEDMNTPPRLFVTDRNRGEKSLLLDLNPQFRSLEFARVEAVKWKATDGHEVSGGLYFPPSYQPGQRYPLVIQTHGFRKDRFWMNGPWNSAFAAQPLASEGILVLQVGDSTETGDDHNLVNTPLEGPRRMAAFEGAIDDLDEKGLIDRSRVGIIGFSRTVFHAEYTLTHSTYRFRAATFADGFEGGYLSYLLWRTADYEGVNGGIPVGDGLNTWIKNSPAFRIENVTAPVRLEYYGSTAFLGGWQWFSVSSLLGKPVDFVWIPHGTHLLIKPSERLVSQQGNVDWFRFWLGDDHNCGAESRETCIRWNELASRANLQGH